VIESALKEKFGLAFHGFDLSTKALSFEFDAKTGALKRAPLIFINDLKTESDRKEQGGVQYMLPRNLYQHKSIGSGPDNTISVMIEASFFLKLLDGHSISKNGHWIRKKTP